MYLWTSGYVRLSGSSSGGVPQFGGTGEPNKRVGCDGAELASTRGAAGANEQNGALWEGEISRVGIVQLRGANAM